MGDSYEHNCMRQSCCISDISYKDTYLRAGGEVQHLPLTDLEYGQGPRVHFFSERVS